MLFEGRNNDSLSPYSYSKGIQDQGRSFERDNDQDKIQPHRYGNSHDNYDMED